VTWLFTRPESEVPATFRGQRTLNKKVGLRAKAVKDNYDVGAKKIRVP
jgi:hypothetical protein